MCIRDSVIGNQKYFIFSLIIALGSSIYALLSRSYTSIISGNSSITPENILNNPLLRFNTFLMIVMPLILLLIILYAAITGFLFLTLHLPVVTMFSVKIEELQRDILFKKMGNIELFSWNEIIGNEKTTFKDFLKQKFISENIIYVITSVNSNCIQIDIYIKNGFFGKEKRSGTLHLDKEKKVAILKIEGIELDHFNVKEENDDLILYESELKYRFGKVMPYYNSLRSANMISLMSIITTIFIALLLFTIFYFIR